MDTKICRYERDQWEEEVKLLPAGSLERTRAKWVAGFAAGLVLAFFLPWMEYSAESVSGFQIGVQTTGGGFVWVLPALATITAGLSLMSGRHRFMAAVCGLTATLVLMGALIFFTNVYELGRGTRLPKYLDFIPWMPLGAYLTFILSCCLVGAAFVESRAERMKQIG